jgi:DnaJ-class molecular chaperone
MTPYAVLLCRPLDSDETIRAAFHGIVRQGALHPDLERTDRVRGEWHEVNDAYQAIKTETLRIQWQHAQALFAGKCAQCRGYGVRGTRSAGGKITVCVACEGRGRQITC